MTKIGLLLVSTLLTIGLGELVVRAFVPVRNVGPSFTMYSSVYGKQLRPSISVTRITPEFTMHLTTNAAGFRQEDEVAAGSHPVIFLGDSFTMGYGVSDGEDFVSLIRAQQPPNTGPYLNAGMGNNGNGVWLKFLREEAPKYSPRLVVLQLMVNDFQENQAESLYTLENGELVELPIPAASAKHRLHRVLTSVPGLSYSYLLGLMRQLRIPSASGAGVEAPRNEPESADELTYRIVDLALTTCEEHGWPVIGLSVELEGTRLQRMRALFARHDVRLLEAPSKRSSPELYYEVDGHWNEAGHARVAAMLMDAFRQ